jgi:hypothetical protein
MKTGTDSSTRNLRITCLTAFIIVIVALQLLTIHHSQSTAQSEHKLAVVICSTTTGNPPLVVEGSFIYVKDGKEITRKIDKTGWGWNVRGEYIKELQVSKISGNGSFQIYVIEDSVTLFESGPVDTLEPVHYER